MHIDNSKWAMMSGKDRTLVVSDAFNDHGLIKLSQRRSYGMLNPGTNYYTGATIFVYL